MESVKTDRKSVNRQNQQMTLKPARTLGLSKETSSIVIKLNLVFNSVCRREETFPISMKYIDVTRSTHTHLDVMQGKRIGDYLECRREQTYGQFLGLGSQNSLY